ncbi:hypothetical protein LCI01_06430 [Leuconostoc citreum]|uniref:hypothetical protein n=1 Tax=Leuconostoc citreum TaxID=33964 RepID=UPI001169F6AB|nr:hypothetical protein [Leuconostoc citreum]GEK61007.1 hypothetical protein LCI01_06430 [Leuconostoc citreum]
MLRKYNVFLAVDYFNEQILFTAQSSGELTQKIIKAIEAGVLHNEGAVRMYRTSQGSFDAIQHLMSAYNLPFHEAARPKGRDYESQTINAVG